jgi:hypothetical protein
MVFGGLIVGVCILAPFLLLAMIPIVVFMLIQYWISFGWACLQHNLWLGRCLQAYKRCAISDAVDTSFAPRPAARPPSPPPRDPSDHRPIRSKPGPPLSPKIASCLRRIETEVIHRPLNVSERQAVLDPCQALLAMAMGEERLVFRLVILEWPSSSGVVDAFARAKDRWERDKNRFG